MFLLAPQRIPESLLGCLDALARLEDSVEDIVATCPAHLSLAMLHLNCRELNILLGQKARNSCREIIDSVVTSSLEAFAAVSGECRHAIAELSKVDRSEESIVRYSYTFHA